MRMLAMLEEIVVVEQAPNSSTARTQWTIDPVVAWNGGFASTRYAITASTEDLG